MKLNFIFHIIFFKMRFFFPMIAIAFISSCTYIPQKVTLSPNLNIEQSSIGKNSSFNINVFDNRSNNKIIGRRGAGLDIAAIKNDQDLANLLKKEIVDGLKKKGFFPSKNSGNNLEVSLINLQYKSLVGIITVGSDVRTSLQATVLDKENNGQLMQSSHL